MSFPSNTQAVALLDAMAKDPHFRPSSPSPEAAEYLARIASASPDSPDLEEDDTGTSWGHYQFQGNPFTIKTTLTSWDAIGSVEFALKFLAESVRTYRVALYLCEKAGLATDNLLSACYVHELVETIGSAWSRAHEVRNSLILCLNLI